MSRQLVCGKTLVKVGEVDWVPSGTLPVLLTGMCLVPSMTGHPLGYQPVLTEQISGIWEEGSA